MAGAPAIGAWPRGGRCARQLLVIGYCLLVVIRVCCERGKCAASALQSSNRCIESIRYAARLSLCRTCACPCATSVQPKC